MLNNSLSKLLNKLKKVKSLNEVAKGSRKFTTVCIVLGIYSSVVFFCLCCAAALFLKIHRISQSTTSNSMGTFKQEQDSKETEVPILNLRSECSKQTEFKDDKNSCGGAYLKDGL